MIIIPARLKSTRLPNKLLLPLGGVPLIIRTAKKAQNFDDVVVACDDEAILQACKAHKIHALLTSHLHSSGTDRCAEVARTLDLPRNEIVINLQGDEPFLEESVVESLENSMRHTHFMASCYKEISTESAVDSNLVKVVISNDNFALYFSRSVIPFKREDSAPTSSLRGEAEAIQNNMDCHDFANAKSRNDGFSGAKSETYNGHIGIYGFFAWSLAEFCALPKSPLESIEKLEQLRALWHRKEIFMTKVSTKSIGIDTQDDYKNAQKIIGDL